MQVIPLCLKLRFCLQSTVSQSTLKKAMIYLRMEWGFFLQLTLVIKTKTFCIFLNYMLLLGHSIYNTKRRITRIIWEAICCKCLTFEADLWSVFMNWACSLFLNSLFLMFYSLIFGQFILSILVEIAINTCNIFYLLRYK